MKVIFFLKAHSKHTEGLAGKKEEQKEALSNICKVTKTSQTYDKNCKDKAGFSGDLESQQPWTGRTRRRG